MRFERLEKERLEEEKQISLEPQQAENRRDMLEKKEDELRNDEVKLEKENDIAMRMLKIAEVQMDEAIDNNDILGIHVSLELVEVGTKKLEPTLKQQIKVRIDIGEK